MNKKQYSKLNDDFKDFLEFQKRKNSKHARGEGEYISIELELYKRKYIERVMDDWKKHYIIN